MKTSSISLATGNAAYLNRAKGMLSLTVRSILYDRKTMAVVAIMLLLLAIPLVWLNDPPSNDENEKNPEMDMFMGITVMIYMQFIVLYVCFLYATALITAESDDRTMTYLISRPIHRLEIVLYKYLGYVFSMFLIFAIPVIMNYLLFAQHDGGLNGIVDNLDILGITLGGVFIGIIIWGALFIFMASVIKNPLMPGFFYCLFWENMIGNMPGNIPKATVTYQIRTFIINGLKTMKNSIADGGDLPPHGTNSADVTFMLAILISMVFILMSWMAIKERDFN
ncbi:MAG: ABC transporter permease subunit [Bacteroidales bacterium]|nr:ABC transporter permease subunit [Bacteroidales bacterium]